MSATSRSKAGALGAGEASEPPPLVNFMEATRMNIRRPLERYLSLCTYLDTTNARDYATYGEFSAHLELVIEEANTIPPPAELSDWHLAVLAFLESMSDLVEAQPADDPIDPLILAPILPSVANL